MLRQLAVSMNVNNIDMDVVWKFQSLNYRSAAEDLNTWDKDRVPKLEVFNKGTTPNSTTKPGV